MRWTREVVRELRGRDLAAVDLEEDRVNETKKERAEKVAIRRLDDVRRHAIFGSMSSGLAREKECTRKGREKRAS